MSYENVNLITLRADKCRPKVAGWLSGLYTSLSQKNLVVVGIEQEGSPTLVAAGHRRNRLENEASILLQSDEAARLYSFYRDTIARKAGWFGIRGANAETKTEYDCFGFARYVKGLADSPAIDPTPTRSRWLPADPLALVNGSMYAIYDRNVTDGVHAALGIENPSLSLSAMGVNAPLVVANNQDLINGFDGHSVMKFIHR